MASAFCACREAILTIGWGVESIEPRRLVIRRGWWAFSRDPARIEVRLSEAGPGATMVALDGHLRWVGGTRDLQGAPRRLGNAMEVVARRSPDR